MMRLGNIPTSTTTFVDLSQYTKSSSSCSTVPTTIDIIPQQTSTFDMIRVLQQVWKGFCIPNNDGSNIQLKDNDDDEDDCNNNQYNNSIVQPPIVPSSSTDVPCCIGVDLTSSSTETTTHVNDHRHRLMSYELEPCSCCGAETVPLDNVNDAMISNDSFDDDEHDNEHAQYHSCRPLDGTKVEDCNYEDVDDNRYGDDDAEEDNESDVEYIIVPLPGPKQSDRILKGLETFICAILFLVITIYLLQKQQEQQQQQLSNYDYNIESNSHQQLLSRHSFFSWHYKDSRTLHSMPTIT
jgi:hypothetical protein